MRRENFPPERPDRPGNPDWDERSNRQDRQPYVPGEVTWRRAQNEQSQRSRLPPDDPLYRPPRRSDMPPGQYNADPLTAEPRPTTGSAGQPGRPVSYPPDGTQPTSGRARAGPAAPARPLTRREIIRRRNRRLKWILIPIALLTVLFLVAGGLVLYYAPLLQLLQSSTSHVIGRGNQEQGITVPSDILSGQRVNVLLLGSDNDSQKFTAGNGLPGNGVLTQTIIVVSMDPASKTLDLISIPRDSWVNFPGRDECMKLDEIAGQGRSPDQAIQFERTIVERDYGIPIWRYAWVGLAGFVKMIDTLGGVDVDVLHPMVDDTYPNDIRNPDDQFGYQRLYIPAGPQHLDGKTALEYVRSRHSDQNGDFGRSQRQQSVLLALEKKLNNSDTIGKIPDLAKDLQGNILTDMSLTEISEVANFAHGVPHNKMKQIVLAPPDYSAGAGTIYRDDGSTTYALLPDWSAVNQTILSTVHPDPKINQNQPCSVNPVPGEWSGDVTG